MDEDGGSGRDVVPADETRLWVRLEDDLGAEVSDWNGDRDNDRSYSLFDALRLRKGTTYKQTCYTPTSSTRGCSPRQVYPSRRYLPPAKVQSEGSKITAISNQLAN